MKSKINFKGLAFSYMLFLLLILLLEIFLRVFLPLHFAGFTDAFFYDEELAYRAEPGLHVNVTDYRQEMQVNPLGTINFQKDFAGYRRLVFALGDSYTQGTGLPADDSYPFHLEMMLNMKDGPYNKDYAVVNLGLAAYGSRQELLVLERYARLLGNPNFVLYMGTSNDYVDDLLFDSGMRHRNIVKGNPRYGIFYKPLDLLLYKTEVGKRLRYVIQESLVRKSSLRKAGDEAKGRPVAELLVPRIKEIIESANKHGAQVIITWSVTDENYIWLKNWAEQNGVPFADWKPAVITVMDALPALPLSNKHSGGHHRGWANTIIARTFMDMMHSLEAHETSCEPAR